MVKVKTKGKSKAGRIRNPKKSQRWAKGESCLSNPTIHKFRDEASSLYFHEVVKNPLLTKKNVGGRDVAKDEDEDVLSADVQSLTVSDARTGLGSFASYKTFASDWSKCSNGAFEKFLGRFKLDSALHKEMLSILAATTEVINSLGGSHRETEYFASFVTALDQCESPQYPAMMALLSIVSGRVPEAVLRRTFGTIYPKVGSILASAMESFDSSLIRVTCDVLKKVLGAQDPSVFVTDPVPTLVHSILRCALHDNPKVRRKARITIGFILSRQKERNGNNTMAKIVLAWVDDQLRIYPTCGSKSAGDTIGLLQFVWSHLDSLSSSRAKEFYESVLRIMSSGDMALIKIGFAFFTTVFQTHLTIASSSLTSSENSLTHNLVKKLVSEFCPDWRNNSAFLLWLHCVMTGLVRLTDDNTQFTTPFISSLMEAIAPTWTSHWGAIPSKVFVDYLFHLVRPEITRNDDIERSFEILSKNLISVPPNEQCLNVLIGFLDTLKPQQFTNSGRDILIQLIQLRGTGAATKINTILGRFVKSFGVDNLWMCFDHDPALRHTVILPLIRDNLSEGQISFWKEHIFAPLHKSESLINDVWNSLVGFCRNPLDPDNFPAVFIGQTGIQSQDQNGKKVSKHRLTALAALRQFALWPQSKPMLQRQAGGFLKILFDEYIQERQVALSMKKVPNAAQGQWNVGHSDAIGKTIQEYLPLLEADVIHDFLERAIEKFNGSKNEEKGPILDLVGFLSVFRMGTEMESQVFSIASSLISDPVHMKRAYRLLQGLLNNESVSGDNVCRIVQLLSESKGTTKSNAEPLRLECIITLLLKNESWWAEFLPETILSLLSVNTKGRRVAIKFVAKLCESLKEEKISLEKLQSIVQLGLESGNSFIISSTIHFLSRVYIQVPPTNPDSGLITNCVNHLLDESTWDASISREALTFLSLNLSLFKSQMGPYAQSIGKLLSIHQFQQGSKKLTKEREGFPRKEINKILGRMIRIFGVAGLRAVLPNADDPKMTQRIKNIQRKIRKVKELKGEAKKRESEKEFEEGDCGESDKDEEDEDEDGGNKARRRRPHHTDHKLIMKEGVVDFLDPKNMTASLINKPNDKEDEDLKFSSDGKLIIEDLDGRRRGLKRTLDEDVINGGSEDEEDDELVSKKRPRTRGGGGRSVASSKRSTMSFRTVQSSGGVSRKTAIAMIKANGGNTNRPQLKGRRRSKRSTQSLQSVSHKSGKKGNREGFNYKK